MYLILNCFISLLYFLLKTSNVFLKVSDDCVQFSGFCLVFLDLFLVIVYLLLQTRELLPHDARLTFQLHVFLALFTQLFLVGVFNVENLAVGVLFYLSLCLFVFSTLQTRLIVGLNICGTIFKKKIIH